MQEVFNKIKEVDSMFAKIDLLQKKEERMGLTEEENKKLCNMRVAYFIKCEQINNEIVIQILNHIMSKKSYEALTQIQKIIPWNGGTMIDGEEIDAIMIAESRLNNEQRDFIEKQLEILHYETFKSIEVYCDTEAGYESFNELGKILSNDKTEDILYSLSYIDNIYREFGEIFGIELTEVEVVK